MAAPMKTLAMRWPAPTIAARQTTSSGFAAQCPRSSFSTICQAKRPAATQMLEASRSFSRANHTISFRIPAVSCLRAGKALGASPLASSGRYFTSTTSKLNDTAAAAAAKASAASASLDWNSFFQLRVKRRRIQLFFSVTMGLVGGAGGAILLSTGLAEPLVAQVPLDPFVTLGLMTVACAGLGWLVGPSIGSQIFYFMNRRYKSQMLQKESEFFARVKKNRVDPSNSSAGNPVPDFYGEKIQSVAGYRRWLKDQRAFNRKKTAAFV
ncbi:Putative Presequence translocase-associated motor subunit [[Torrubiella] hemipterigena]|uniref:Presequence translocated-associated motor subunit PAM17 n=1 Tax=[Torrubiella] hemipterigena TaxID=1531966 RepID=A0A0A1TPY2_9HYPO|nr:Putative Presequence translocase-associated motor subunit [[Torrubiella] hemipterigena]